MDTPSPDRTLDAEAGKHGTVRTICWSLFRIAQQTSLLNNFNTLQHEYSYYINTPGGSRDFEIPSAHRPTCQSWWGCRSSHAARARRASCSLAWVTLSKWFPICWWQGMLAVLYEVFSCALFPKRFWNSLGCRSIFNRAIWRGLGCCRGREYRLRVERLCINMYYTIWFWLTFFSKQEGSTFWCWLFRPEWTEHAINLLIEIEGDLLSDRAMPYLSFTTGDGCSDTSEDVGCCTCWTAWFFSDTATCWAEWGQ